MKLNSFAGKRVVIMGLGLHGGGVGVAKFFAKQGAEVLVTDLKTKSKLTPSILQLKGYQIEYVLGKHRVKDFKAADLIMKNPAVPFSSPFLEIARKQGVPIESEMSLFFNLCPAEIVGITGTKGKSTVATLIFELLKTKFKKVVLAGNIRVSALEKLKQIDDKTIVVLELSSFQLEDLKISPRIAVVTNILEDHLDRYNSFKDYVGAKKMIFRYQKPDDFLILNYDNNTCRRFAKEAKSRVYFYGRGKVETKNTKLSFNKGAQIEDDKILFDKKDICKIDDIKLRGYHNIENILAAVTVAKIKKVPSQQVRKILMEFEGVSLRLELIDKVKGVSFFNDTCATNPSATIAALKSFEKSLILIAGGAEKNLSFDRLAKAIAEKTKFLILLEGTATKRLEKEIRSALKNKNLPLLPENIKNAKSMKEAVILAQTSAKENDLVLLSPACSSFGMFDHEFDRGEQFKTAVKQLRSKIKKN